MKLNIIFLLTALSMVMMSCGGTKAAAQAPANLKDITPAQMAEQQTNKMTEVLDLGPKQQKVVKAINLKYAKKMKAISQQPRSLNKLNALKGINKDKSAEMKAALTKSQYKAYEKMMEEQQNNRKRRRRG